MVWSYMVPLTYCCLLYRSFVVIRCHKNDRLIDTQIYLADIPEYGRCSMVIRLKRSIKETVLSLIPKREYRVRLEKSVVLFKSKSPFCSSEKGRKSTKILRSTQIMGGGTRALLRFRNEIRARYAHFCDFETRKERLMDSMKKRDSPLKPIKKAIKTLSSMVLRSLTVKTPPTPSERGSKFSVNCR